MNTNNDDQRMDQLEHRSAAPWAAGVLALIGIAGAGYGFYRDDQADRILKSQQSGQQQLSEMRAQVQSLQNRLNTQAARERELVTALESATSAASIRQQTESERPATQPARRSSPQPRPTSRNAARNRPVEDPRVSQLEKRVAEQDEKLVSTQKLVESARMDLEGRIDSTSQELSGSIARTAEEVAALRLRGERDYFEFEIIKSKQLHKVGPVHVALRKADLKHKRYNLDLLVDDNKLEKKNVNLFEPVYIASPEWPQPMQLVVNKVTKDRVVGYISVPKQKRAQVAQSGAPESVPVVRPEAQPPE